jgi:hypothetical protein
VKLKAAYEILNLSETANAPEIEKAYQETINEFNIRIRDAVTPILKQKYQGELKIREEAFNVILKSNLPSQHPSFVIPKPSETISEIKVQAKSKSKTNLLILIGAALIILLAVVIYNQEKKTDLNKAELSNTDSTKKNTLSKDSIIPVNEQIITEQKGSNQSVYAINSVSTNASKNVYAIFKEIGKYGLKQGSTVIIKANYDSLFQVPGSKDLYIVLNMHPLMNAGLVNSKGKFIVSLSEDYYLADVYEKEHLVEFRKSTKNENKDLLSFVNFEGIFLLKSEYIQDWEVVVDAKSGKPTQLLYLIKDDCAYYLNMLTKKVTPCYYYGERVSNRGEVKVFKSQRDNENNNFIYIDQNGKEIVPTK